jgi:hypothetical protein
VNKLQNLTFSGAVAAFVSQICVATKYSGMIILSFMKVSQLVSVKLIRVVELGRNRDSSVGIAITLQAGRMRFDSRQGLGMFLFATVSRPALGPTQPADS